MKGGLPHKSEQEAALREAQECLEAMKREGFQLDGFNLLSVVASPRTGMSSHSTHPSSRHGNSASTSPIKESSKPLATTTSPLPQAPSLEITTTTAQESDMFTDAFSTLGNTLTQVT